MTAINVSERTKREFDDLQPKDATQDDFVQTLLETYQKDVNGVVIDVDEIVEEINHEVASECELAAYRGVKEALGEL